jgi:chromate reductase, NAD(P)H dehydrogenase (quinone)
MRILSICGSLRRVSSNGSLLRAAALLAPPDVEVVPYSRLADLPAFNPDLEGSEGEAVLDWRARLTEADGLLISSPEYAHGVVGALKNAFDWVVASNELEHKPVALWNASRSATIAFASLTETMRVMSAAVIEEACVTIPVSGKPLDADVIAATPELAVEIRESLAVLARAIAAARV